MAVRCYRIAADDKKPQFRFLAPQFEEVGQFHGHEYRDYNPLFNLRLGRSP